MRVIVGFTELHPYADAALTRWAPQAERFQLGPQFDAYHTLLAGIWQEGQGFLNIEHDVEIHADVVHRMRYCPHSWCLYPYRGDHPNRAGDGTIVGGLGCTRFHTSLVRREADLMATLPVKGYKQLDCHIKPALLDRGYAMHIHSPPVTHHHVYYPGSLCACGQEAGHDLPEGSIHREKR